MPAIAFSGAFSLKKNGAPTGRRTARVDGRQKFASLGAGSRARRSYQPGSVMATKPFTVWSTAPRSEAVPGDPLRRVRHLATGDRISLIGYCTYMNGLIILVSGEGGPPEGMRAWG